MGQRRGVARRKVKHPHPCTSAGTCDNRGKSSAPRSQESAPMPLLCTCPQGHHWEHASSPTDAPLSCPVCGGPAVVTSEGEAAPSPLPPFRPESLSLDAVRHGVTDTPQQPAPP